MLNSESYHPNRFATKLARDFLFDVCAEMASRGIFRLFALEIDGRIVACRIGFVVGDSLYLYYSGFDPAWRKFSVMTTTVAEAIKYAIRSGLKTVNLSPVAERSKTRWSPRVIGYHIAYEKRPRLLSHAAHRGYRYVRASNNFPARLLRRLIKARRDWE
jgi:CelD/BcsL family acetyltransferase involved in cellulose biosynthesis